eukprot:640601-Hanusia_phi.AAC.1
MEGNQGPAPARSEPRGQARHTVARVFYQKQKRFIECHLYMVETVAETRVAPRPRATVDEGK